MRKAMLIKLAITVGIVAYMVHPMLPVAASLVWLWVDL